jgi:NADH dehydrogenase
MRVFITGGTGFVGSVVVREIKNSGADITLLERNKKKIPYLKKEGYDVFEGSLENAESLNDFLSENKFDAIVNLIGIIKSLPDFSFQKVHVDYVEILVELAKKNGIGRFIHMSANGASENTDSIYFTTKYEGEILVKNSGLIWTIFKPSVIFGDNAGFFDDLINLVKTRLFVPVIGAGDTKFAPIDVFSVAKAYVCALTDERTYDKSFYLCGSDIFTFEEIIDLIMEISPPKKIKIHAPSFIAEKGVSFLEKFLTNSGLPITSDQIRMLNYDNICEDNMKENDELFNFEKTHLKDWLKDYLKKYSESKRH